MKTFRLVAWELWLVLALALSSLPLIAAGALLALPLNAGVGLASSALWLAAYGVARKAIVLGDDGFLIRRLGRTRMVRWSDVASVVRTRGGSTSSGVRVHMNNGRCIDFDHEPRFGRTTLDDLFAAMTGSFAAYQARPARHLPEAISDARAENAGSLRGALARGPAFRDAALTREQLWSVVEDPAADQRVRAAAAIAVAGSLREEDRVRIRAVAGRTVFPRLRVALTAVADGANDAALDAELEALGGDDRRTSGITARRSGG